MSEQEDVRLFEDVRAEAEAIVEEAKQQARLLLEAGQRRQGSESKTETDKIRSAGQDLAKSLENAIANLTAVLDDLRAYLD